MEVSLIYTALHNPFLVKSSRRGLRCFTLACDFYHVEICRACYFALLKFVVRRQLTKNTAAEQIVVRRAD